MSSPVFEIHPRFPEVHAAGFEDATDEFVDVDLQVEHHVRGNGESVQVPQPLAIDPAHAGARERGEDIPIRQDDEAGLERRDDFLFQPVGEVGGVEQDEGQLVEGVARFRQLDRRLHQGGPRPPGLHHAVALDLQPFAQQLNLRAASHAVSPFDGDELAWISLDRQVGDPLAVVAAGLDRRLRRSPRFPPFPGPSSPGSDELVIGQLLMVCVEVFRDEGAHDPLLLGDAADGAHHLETAIRSSMSCCFGYEYVLLYDPTGSFLLS